MIDHHAIQFRDHFRSFWRPDPECPVWLWAENNIVLSPMESADMAGPFSSAVTPFIREPLECFRDESVTELTLLFGTQIAKTLMIMLGVAWWLEHHAGRCIWVMDTESNARSFSETRWQPLLRECPALADKIPTGREDFKKLQQRIGNSLIHFVGSNSPGNLASRPADLAVMDEVDKFAVTSAREANAVDLVEQRTKSRANTKIVKTSSPTTETGLIWLAYCAGDQRQYHVPCPYCGEYIRLDFSQVKWSPAAKVGNRWDMTAVRNSARYICQSCEGEIHDGQKTAMLRNGKWIPTNPQATPGVRSYQLSSLYSPWAKTTFGNLAVEFLRHKARFDLKAWDNGYLARPSTESVEKIKWEALSARRERYVLGEIDLEKVALCTAFCDVQDSWLEWFVWGWGEGTEGWLVEHEVMHGDPSKMSGGVWDALAETIAKSRQLQLDWTFIDYGGHHGQEAIEFARKMVARKVYLHKGSSVETDPVNGRVTWTKKPRARLFLTGVGNAKRACFCMLAEDSAGPGYQHFPNNTDDEFFKQLCAEELRTKYVKGSPVEYWFQTRPRNEAWDGFVGCYAGLKRLNAGLLRRRFAELAARKKIGAERAPVDNDQKQEQTPAVPVARGRRRGARRVVRPGSGFVGGF